MPDRVAHSTLVESWLDGAAKSLPPAELLLLFELATTVLWRRAHRTLGEVTLMAIADRVISTSSEQHPALAALHTDAEGIHFNAFHEEASSKLEPPQIGEVRLFLVEFLTVLGNLTDEILTPGLHHELLKVTLSEAGASKGIPE